MKLKVNITRNDIQTGVCCEPKKCAVANAIQKILRKGYVASVNGCTAKIVTPTYPKVIVATIHLNGDIRNLIFQFDGGQQVKPLRTSLKINANAIKYFKPSALEE